MPPIVVYDTNVLFSWTRWRGTPYRCVELARHGIVVGLICDELLDELVGVLTRRKYSITEILSKQEDLVSFLKFVEIPGQLHGVCADPDDDMVIECAVVGGATHLITGDTKHLLPLQRYQGVLIVSPAEFIEQFP